MSDSRTATMSTPASLTRETAMRFDPISAAALDDRSVPRRHWHVPELIPARNVSMLSGDGGTGKSLLALQLAVATALGKQWIGRASRSGGALYVAAEDDLDELHRRLADIVAAEGARLTDLDALSLKSLAGADALLAVLDGSGRVLRETPLYVSLAKWIAEHRPSLVVLDTLADLFGGDEINRGQARQFVGLLQRLALEFDCAVLLLAHPSLSGLSRGDGASGSTAWNNSVRSRLNLKSLHRDGDAGQADLRVLETVKANYSRTGNGTYLRWRDGVFLPVSGGDNDGSGEPGLAKKADQVFIAILRECNAKGRKVNSSSGSNYAPSVFASHPDADGVTKRAFRIAMERALADGSVRIDTEGPPSRRASFLVAVPPA